MSGNSTIRASQRRRAVSVDGPRGMSLVVVACPVPKALWTMHTVAGELVVERVVDGSQADGLMSRQHATVRHVSGRLELRDGVSSDAGWKPSANGTLGPTGAPLGDDEVMLHPGDTFQTGDTLWLVIRTPDWVDEDTLLVGFSDSIQRARENVGLAARQTIRRLDMGNRVNLSLLVTGPRGSGKQVVAREAHRILQMVRPDAPFRQVSAPNLSDGTASADLFGVVKNYATGVGARAGYFEQVHGGVLLLDEVGDTPLDAQAKILNVLQEREVVRLGGTESIPFDALIVGATNQPLAEEETGMRRDLIDRLATFRVELLPLRHRPEDIPPLVRHLLKRIGYTDSLSAELMRALAIRWWPGNVRELNNSLERMIALAELRGKAPSLKLLERVMEPDLAMHTHPPQTDPDDRPEPIRRVTKRPTKDQLIRALDACNGNRSELARRWNSHARQIRRWVKYYGLTEE